MVGPSPPVKPFQYASVRAGPVYSPVNSPPASSCPPPTPSPPPQPTRKAAAPAAPRPMKPRRVMRPGVMVLFRGPNGPVDMTSPSRWLPGARDGKTDNAPRDGRELGTKLTPACRDIGERFRADPVGCVLGVGDVDVGGG